MGGMFKTGKSKSMSVNATARGLDYLDQARTQLGDVSPQIIQNTLQQRLDNLGSLMSNMSSMAQMQAQQNMNKFIPGATNSAGSQAMAAILPQIMQAQDQAYAQAGSQQLGVQELLGQLAAQYAALTGYSKSKTTNPGMGTSFLGGLGKGVGSVLGGGGKGGGGNG